MFFEGFWNCGRDLGFVQCHYPLDSCYHCFETTIASLIGQWISTQEPPTAGQDFERKRILVYVDDFCFPDLGCLHIGEQHSGASRGSGF